MHKKLHLRTLKCKPDKYAACPMALGGLCPREMVFQGRQYDAAWDQQNGSSSEFSIIAVFPSGWQGRLIKSPHCWESYKKMMLYTAPIKMAVDMALTLLPPSVREYYISLQELCGLGYTFKSKVPIEKLWGIFLCVPEVCPIIGGSFIGIVYCGPCCTSIYRTVPCCSFAQFFAIEKKITCVAGIRSKWRRS